MKVQQSFAIDQPRARVWDFLLSVPDVARCVPGVEDVEVLDEQNSRVRLTQAVGPMSATFDLRMRITERQEPERMQFTASGKAVKGAAGSVRTINTVCLFDDGDGTRVDLDAEMAMGGVLGSIGQKVIAKQARSVTAEFAQALERALNAEPVGDATTEPEPLAADATAASAETGRPPAGARRAPRPQVQPTPVQVRLPWYEDPRVTGLAGLAAGLTVALAVALRRR